jgi:hypothetical protein
MPAFPRRDKSLLNLEALIPILSAISALLLGLSSKAIKHKALTEDDNFVDADINIIIVTVSVTYLTLKCNSKIKSLFGQILRSSGYQDIKTFCCVSIKPYKKGELLSPPLM